ncbi:MAG: M14 family metallopeptidase [Alphaproteobacteria bacterium]
MSAGRYFAATYAEARDKFRAAAAGAGAALTRYDNPAPGPDGLALSTDVALLGPADAERVMLVLSSTHGGEGFCGSGIQGGWLAEGRGRQLPDGVAAVLVYAINPSGFAWIRRANEDNVDINRNFIDHDAGHPHNSLYADIKHALIPDGPFENLAKADAALTAFKAKHGEMAVLTACSGQYQDPDGIFFGGRQPVWSNRTLSAIVRDHLPAAKMVAHIDLHTGLGPYGVGEAISYHKPGAREHDKALAWYAENVTTPYVAGASAPVNKGKTGFGVSDALPAAEVVCVTLEYGTYPQEDVIQAIREEHWLWRHGDEASAEGQAIRAKFRKMFYPDEDRWKEMVWARGDQVLRGAAQGLGAA